MADEPRPPAGAWRTYLELASGLGEASRKRVRRVVKDLIGKGNATAEQLRVATVELVAANAANREALGKLVKVEVDRALGRVGLATMDEVNDLTARVRDLERQLRDARAVTAGTVSAGGGRPVAPSPMAKKTVRKATRAPAAKAPATGTRATATRAKATRAAAPAATTAKVTTAKATTRRTTAAKATPAKATTNKATARKATARKATARKATASPRTTRATGAGRAAR
jgi:polyhydroxyalkanoate synthesis regulator phasin